MHSVLPHQRSQNHSETIIKAVKIRVRKGLVVSCPQYHTRWEWSLFVPFFPASAFKCAFSPWKTVKYEHPTELQRPRSPSRHSCYQSVKGRDCRAVTCGEKAEELHQPQQKSQHQGADVTKGVRQMLTAICVNSTTPCAAPPLAISSRTRLLLTRK